MFKTAKEKLMLKSQGSRAQLKLTPISIMVVKNKNKNLHFCRRLTEIASVWLVMCEVMLIWELFNQILKDLMYSLFQLIHIRLWLKLIVVLVFLFQ